jgi:hypothetical protein
MTPPLDACSAWLNKQTSVPRLGRARQWYKVGSLPDNSKALSKTIRLIRDDVSEPDVRLAL